jgi:hypothetical protein
LAIAGQLIAQNCGGGVNVEVDVLMQQCLLLVFAVSQGPPHTSKEKLSGRSRLRLGFI